MIRSNGNSSSLIKSWKQSQPFTTPFKGQPLVTFDRVSKELREVVPNFSDMIQTMKKRAVVRPADLDEDRFKALQLAALTWQPSSQSFLSLTNDVIHQNDPRDYSCWFTYLRLLDDALERLPSTRKKIFCRSLPDDFDQSAFIGERFFWSGILTCTLSVTDLRSDHNTILFLHCTKGKDISALAKEKSIPQIILPFDVEFRIVGYEKHPNGYQVIIAKELSLLTDTEQSKMNKISRSIQRLNLQRIDHIENFSELNLKDKAVTDCLMNYIGRIVLMKKRVLWLSLSKTQITHESLVILTESVSEEIPLESLHLSQNHLSSAKMEIWLTSLFQFCPHLSFLNLIQTSIDDTGAEILAQILQTNRTLYDLWLSQNNIGNKGVRALAKTLSDHNQTLTQLYLSHNPLIDDASIDCLKSMLISNQTLDTLHLEACSFSRSQKLQLVEVADRNGYLDFVI